eukprot:6190559-Pleurochrysis_carterae.AAC.2
MAEALMQCKRANMRLRAALSVPPSDSNHDYLRFWVYRVGACDLDDLVRDDALFDLPVPERSSPALALHPSLSSSHIAAKYGTLPATQVAVCGVLLSDL